MAKTKRKGKTQEIAKSAMTILKTKLTGRLNPRTDNEAIFFLFHILLAFKFDKRLDLLASSFLRIMLNHYQVCEQRSL